jgi:hypothetical protein
LLALLGGATIVVVSRLRVKGQQIDTFDHHSPCTAQQCKSTTTVDLITQQGALQAFGYIIPVTIVRLILRSLEEPDSVTSH